MRIIFTCLISLLLFSTPVISNDRGTPWLVSWPFFQNAQAPHSINGGYGDWCAPIEGMHPGLDFAAAVGDSVLMPTDSVRIALDLRSNATGYALALGSDSSSIEGWYLGHLDVDNSGYYPFYWGAVVMDHIALAPCLQNSSRNDTVPLHMHIQWTDIPLPSIPPRISTIPIRTITS